MIIISYLTYFNGEFEVEGGILIFTLTVIQLFKV